ncbi:MAG: AraC family transcriptional regulator [Rhodospirillum sp.]|nr:AraC family transcriptional regulator [Rhodospirillum sp.]MCF8487819.1 AraC family transcriptional regulator [Rhodospirillum sp.]MCF8499917.1 AraC family transcriptional regulator [Rhodospirillum sp.]
MTLTNAPFQFVRDPALPYLEARVASDARRVCYAPHSHRTFSIGVITGGRSECRIGGSRRTVGDGVTVVIDPEEIHACNPLEDCPWSYRMVYVDPDWLGQVQGERGAFYPHGVNASEDRGLHKALSRLVEGLFDPSLDSLVKDVAAVAFFSGLKAALGEAPPPEDRPSTGLDRAAAFITDRCVDPLRLEEIRAVSGLSLSHFVRAFKRRYGLTPHAYQLNRRVQKGQELLRRGRPIAEVALDVGFADQAHFQRIFKRLLAVTPGRYAAG